MKNKKLILLRGLPGSGKSTLAKTFDTEFKTMHLEADMFFLNYDASIGSSVYKFDANQLHQAHQWCQERTNFWLQEGYTVIVSNTFTTIKELRPYFDIGYNNGVLPLVYLAQNQFKNVHDVPEESLERMKRRFVFDVSPLVTEYKLKLGV